MKSAAGRIREHIQTVILLFLSIIDIDRILFPVLTPLALNGGVVVLCHDAFLLHFISLKAVQNTLCEFRPPLHLPESRKILILFHCP